ncbi:fibronectin type III domain-containing protein [Spirosoma foliorum]|uniref:Fibronectin type III domain-containing protein n=1 Tax=Spirosoma foliorum TaxID=2710596 RepID=A0A7G5GVI3_9BACT|nr:fibronectin type III domain-containing protein [Spirosoma foliorum]QMW02875.1 fibronectin type III domain-containing protein [Spirosoma foliorum]
MKSRIGFLVLSLMLLASTHLLAQSNAPTNLSGTAPAYNRVVLTWKDNSTNETKFEIERNNFASYTKIGEVSANVTTYTDNTTGGGTYRVRAVFATGAASGYSNEFTITTPPEPPGMPTGLTATLQNGSVVLSWSNGSGGTASTYRVERSVQGGAYSLYQTVSYSRAPTLTDNGVLGGQQYCYRVQAVNTGGSSGYAGPACQTIPLTPTNIKNLTATTLSSSSIKLNWTPYGKESGITIERRKGQTGNFDKIKDWLADSGEFTDTGLESNTEYCYRIGESGHDYSAIVCKTTLQSIPAAPGRMQAQAVAYNRIDLQWADLSNNETRFEVERSTNGSAGTYTKLADVGANTTKYSDQSVQASTQYCYRVRAVNDAGASGYTDPPACATTPAPPAGVPQNVAAVATSTTQINVSWDAVAGASGYQLERSPNGNDGWQQIGPSPATATTFSDNERTPNTRYYYRVRAVNSAGVPGDYSGVANAITPDVPPADPARLTITSFTYNQVSLQWADLSNNEAGFQIERSTDGANWSKIADAGANATAYADQSVQPQTHYYYRIRAVNAAGSSNPSNVVDITTPAGPPVAAQDLKATATSTTQISLTWSAIANATSIVIERSPDGSSNWNSLTTVAGTATSYTDNGLTPNQHYYYRIRATNASGTGNNSNVADATTPDVPPTAPTNLTITSVTYSQISLQWADNSTNESGFVLERSPDGATFTKLIDLPANTTTYNDQTVAPQTHYYYQVRAVNAAGPSGNSNVVDATTPVGPPTAAQDLKATAISTTQISLAWTAIPNAATIVIERSPDGVSNWTSVSTVAGTATSYTDNGLTKNQHYYYRIRATNVSGTGNNSNVADAATPDVPPAAPARLTATVVSTSQINLVWADLSNNESGFEIERGTSATGTFTKIMDVPANTTTYEDKNLTDDTQYCYRVRAKNAAGPSAYTDAACATTPLAPPATPTNLVAQVFDYDQIKLTWAAVSAKAVTIVIERASNPNGPFSELKQIPASQTSYVDMGLQEFTTYYYRIKAVNTAGSSDYSNVATARVEEVIIAVEDELETHTTLFVSQRTLHVITNWFTTAQTTIQLHTASGGTVLTDNRKVRPADRWDYNLDTLPTGLYIINIVADGRKLAKRILLP